MNKTESTMQNELTAYLTALRDWPATVEHQQQALTPSPSVTPRADRIRERLAPLKDRLAVVLAKIPHDIQADGIHLDEIWGSCLGRQRSKPPAHAVAAALRDLGWVRVRQYPGNDSEPAVTLWFPPLPVADIKKGKL